MLLIFSVILDLVLHFIENFVIIYKVRKIIMIKIFMSFVFIMLISLPSVLAYSPQDNFIQQNIYEITGVYIGETVEELNQQNLLITDSVQGNTIPLKTVGIAGVILKKETIANIADNRLCSLVISFDRDNIEKTKALGFCVNIKHAQYMANFFNQNSDVKALALNSRSSSQERANAHIGDFLPQRTDLIWFAGQVAQSRTGQRMRFPASYVDLSSRPWLWNGRLHRGRNVGRGCIRIGGR